MAGALVIAAGGVSALAEDGQRRHPYPATAALRDYEKLLTFETRPGVTVRLHIAVPGETPKGVFLMFPGGTGFLVNARGRYYGMMRGQFRKNGYATAVMDAPSDQTSGMEDPPFDSFRHRETYTGDIRATIEKLKKAVPGPIYLFGHSMGAISAAHAAANVTDPDIRAVIMAGSPTRRRERMWHASTLMSAALHKIRIPALFVHNRDDQCSGATFDEASDYPRLLTASPRVTFLEASGGTSKNTSPCYGQNYHSFSGIRAEVARAVIRWLNGENVTRVE
jgi:alpha-beta hydrolase superfamily lysophospholipase